MQLRALDESIRDDRLLIIEAARGRCKRTWLETERNDIMLVDVREEMIFDIAEWTIRIHVANPKN